MQQYSYRFLVYCTDFTPQQSGYVHAFTQLIRNMADHGVRVDVVTPHPLPDGTGEFVHPNVEVIRYRSTLNIWLLGLLYQNYQTSRFLQHLDTQHPYDIILIETGDNPYLPAALSESLRLKTVVRFHSTSDTEYLVYSAQRKYKIKRFVWKWLSAARVRYVAATSSYHLRFVQEYLGFKSDQTSYHKLVNASEHKPQSIQSAANQRSFIMLGRMDEEGFIQKGYEILLTALKECASLFQQTGALFTIIGRGKRFNEVSEYISNNHLDFVKLIPSCSHTEVIEKLSQSDIVVLPSKYEGVSMFALEALAEHNAVIFTQTGGLLDMLHNNGMGIPVDDSRQLSNALKQMLLLGDSELQHMKEQSAAWCRQEFSPAKQWEQLQEILTSVKGNQ